MVQCLTLDVFDLANVYVFASKGFSKNLSSFRPCQFVPIITASTRSVFRQSRVPASSKLPLPGPAFEAQMVLSVNARSACFELEPSLTATRHLLGYA